jgi:hypothetical protein
MMKCPGCGEYHAIYVEQKNHLGAQWKFNGDESRPTFTPSVRVTWPDRDPNAPGHVCHFFVTAGAIQYCGDSTHALAGRTVAMVEMD